MLKTYHIIQTQWVPAYAFSALPEVLPFFRHNQVVFSWSKGENWFTASTNIAILKTRNYWSRD